MKVTEVCFKGPGCFPGVCCEFYSQYWGLILSSDGWLFRFGFLPCLPPIDLSISVDLTHNIQLAGRHRDPCPVSLWTPGQASPLCACLCHISYPQQGCHCTCGLEGTRSVDQSVFKTVDRPGELVVLCLAMGISSVSFVKQTQYSGRCTTCHWGVAQTHPLWLFVRIHLDSRNAEQFGF